MLDLNFQFFRTAFRMHVCAQIHAPITGILGVSGSGKSTLLAVIAGLLKPQHGWVTLNEATLSYAQLSTWVPPHKRRVGLVFQDGQLLPHLSVRNNLLYGYRNISPEQRRFDLARVADVLEISHLLTRNPRELSGGEKQRVALGRAVLYSPAILLLDEPLSALDERLKNKILPFFLSIKAEFNIPMIYVTHSVRELEALTETYFIMHQGELSAP